MDSIINKLTEIEDAASAIVAHAEDQKTALDNEYDKKRRDFDAALEADTQARIREIRGKLEKDTSRVLDTQSDENTASIEALRKEYEEKHTEYARDILRRITEV